MKLDVHTHAFHPKIANKVLAQLNGHYGINPVGTGTVDDLLDRAAKAELDGVVIHTAATDPSQVIPANNWALELMREKPGVIAFGSMHPDFDRIEEELDRIERNGIKGLKFHPDFQGFRMDDPKFFELMEIVGGRFALMFHVGDVLPPEENPSCPAKLARLREMFPEPVMIAAHMGGYRHWEYALEHLCGKDVYFDTSSTLDFVDDDLLGRLFHSHGLDRLLFGSDYPLYDPGQELDELKRRMALTSIQVDQLLVRASFLLQLS